MRLRRVVGRRDVVRRPERAVDVLLDVAAPHAKVGRRPVRPETRRRVPIPVRADVLLRVGPERVPRPAVAPAALDAAVEHGAVRDRVMLVREVRVAPPLRLRQEELDRRRLEDEIVAPPREDQVRAVEGANQRRNLCVKQPPTDETNS